MCVRCPPVRGQAEEEKKIGLIEAELAEAKNKSVIAEATSRKAGIRAHELETQLGSPACLHRYSIASQRLRQRQRRAIADPYTICGATRFLF